MCARDGFQRLCEAADSILQAARTKAHCNEPLIKRGRLCSECDGIYSFLRRYEETGYIQRKLGSGRPSQVTAEVKVIDEAKMQEDDETTAVQLNCLLNGKGFPISLRTILRCRSTLGESPPKRACCK